MTYYRREYNIFGRVQGVGLRYTVKHLARAYGLTGWVRNEYDGSVTLALQGRRVEDFDLVIDGLQQDRFIRIEEIGYRNLEPVENERSFSVRY
ncbi:MAG: acylphosphatase [Lachnospiraceae bacterium]|nr:acylphosphatase [Lachnospiraceae bacterium]